MEPWERVFWLSAPAFPSSVFRPRTEYVLTDFRLFVRRHGRITREIALEDITGVRLEQSWRQRLTATSTVWIHSRLAGRSIEIADVHQGPQLALILQLRATGDLETGLDAAFVRNALAPDAPRLLRPNHALVAAATLAFVITFVIVGLARHDTLAPVVYAPEDAIAPNGHRRTESEIIAFMEGQVMPFAKRVLGPLKGGAHNVTCQTCHGVDATARHWRMPGVRKLPEPQVRLAGLERSGFWLDPQMRNAVYGYLAEEENQPKAAYMRGVVMPGMAAVMHRPTYDFTRSYGYNRARVAVGCYHCHLVN